MANDKMGKWGFAADFQEYGKPQVPGEDVANEDNVEQK